MTSIIAISNSKGGVAKTTTCLSLGACLSELGHRTLVVDLDPQADLTMAAGLDADALTWSVADLLAPDDAVTTSGGRAVVYTTVVDRLYILPSNPRLAEVERALYAQSDYEMRLAQKLGIWRSTYEYILLDCPPSLGALMLMACAAAQWVIIPVQCEYYAARRLKRLIDVFSIVKERINPSLEHYLLATMFDQRTRINRGVLAQLRHNFPDRMLDTVIGIDTRLRESPAAGEPITVYDPKTRGAEHYRALAHELLTKFS